MSLFRSRRKPKPPAPKKPDVFVWHTHDVFGSVTRFFFTESLIEASYQEGSTLIIPGMSQESLAMIREIKAIVPGGEVLDNVRPYPHYVAISWKHDELSATANEAATGLEKEVIALLAQHFSWDELVVGYFYSYREVWVMADRIGIKWNLGSHTA